MSLPRKVREQAAAAEAKLKEITESEAIQAPEEQAPVEQVEEAPETQPEEVASEQIEEAEQKAVNWEERYKVLQGKYNAEVPRLQKELKELKDTGALSNDSALRAEIDALKAQLNQPPPAPPQSAMIDKIRDDYGNELADAFAAQKSENDALKARIDDLLQRTSQMQSTNSVDTLSRILADKGINFEQQNNDPLFLDWLAEVDTFAGVSRQQLLTQAYESGDLSRAAHFFVAYSSSVTPPAKTEPKPKPSLEDQVRVQSEAAPRDNVPGDIVMWTQEQINEFYRNKTKGMYTPEEAERLENQLFTALRA